MSSVNKVILIGRVGKEPELRQTANNNKIASFSFATSEKWTDNKGQKQESTEWLNIEVWDKLADIVEKYIKKGSLLYVEGKIKTDTWEKDGQKHYRTKVAAYTIQMLGCKDLGNGVTVPDLEGQKEIDDLPF